MGLTVLSLAATLWAAVAPASPAAVPMASTYDEATCASLHAGDDDWAHAAIGEMAPSETDCPQAETRAAQPSRAALVKLDCDEPAPWPMIGTCAVPRMNGKEPRLHAVTDHAPRRAFRLLAQPDSTPPLAPPPPTHEVAPLHVSSTPTLTTPLAVAHVACWTTPSLRSISTEPGLRPPAA